MTEMHAYCFDRNVTENLYYVYFIFIRYLYYASYEFSDIPIFEDFLWSRHFVPICVQMYLSRFPLKLLTLALAF